MAQRFDVKRFSFCGEIDYKTIIKGIMLNTHLTTSMLNELIHSGRMEGVD
jgi:hypothetical protein